LIGLIGVGGVALLIFIATRADRSDVVSTAREDWLHRRSDKDEQGW
jgi:hypothetical protein